MQTNYTKIFLLSIFLLLLWQNLYSQPELSPVITNSNNGKDKSILIFNSYHPETKWSEEIVSGLKTTLNKQYPDLHIYSGNLNIEDAQTSGTLLLSLRAIIWQMAEQEGDTINPENQKTNSLYRIRKLPDIIVVIGEEAYFTHLSMHLWQGNWTDIPIVCCAFNDSISNIPWYPETPIDFSHLQAASAKVNQQRLWSPASISKKKSIQKLLTDIGFDLPHKTIQTSKGTTAYLSEYHTTKVLMEIPVRENLQLLKHLMPDLQEIVWVDNHYYKNAYVLNKLRRELPNILPDVKLSVMIHNKINTDSIYDVMLTPRKNRVFVTYAWNINGIYSRRPQEQIDSLFSHVLTSPILTFTERQIDKDYWLGGVHNPSNTVITKTIEQISKILNGNPVDSIPSVQVNQPEIHLNVPALKRFGLEKKAQQLTGVIYKNIPPTFYKQHEKIILIVIILIVILLASATLIIKRFLFTKKIQIEYINYRKLYKRLQIIYQNSSIDFALYDQKGRLTYRVMGGKETNLTENISEILSNNLFSNPHLKEDHKQLIQNNQTINKEIEIEATENSKEKNKWNLIVKTLNTTDNQEICYMAIAIDLTPLVREQKAKERSEHIFRFTSETAGVGVASYNLLTGKLFASPTWYHNLNEYPKKDSLPSYRHVCEKDRQAILTHLKQLHKEYIQTPFIRTIRVKNKHEKYHYVQEYIFVQQYAPDQGIIAVVELNQNYDIPKQRENELKKAKEKAELSNLETEQFLANISHEIRTPLNAIVGFSSILATGMYQEEEDSLAPIIEQNNNLLIALIDNILYLSKLDSGTLTFNFASIDPEQLFIYLANYARNQAALKPIEIIVSPPTPDQSLILDEVQFKLVMINLISNAVKFTSRGQITIGYEKRQKEHYFYIKDTGCGIHPEDQERIFKRFEKLDVFTQGTGLGLALCRSSVTHQGGQIGVISVPGEGSTFYFTLPENPKTMD